MHEYTHSVIILTELMPFIAFVTVGLTEVISQFGGNVAASEQKTQKSDHYKSKSLHCLCVEVSDDRKMVL